MSVLEFSEYKDHPVVILKRNQDDRYPWTFGCLKAKMFLEHLDEIRKFVAQNDKDREGGRE